MTCATAPSSIARRCLRRSSQSGGCPRVIFVDHVVGGGDRLFEEVRGVGAEGIVAKRAGNPYRPGPGRAWLKTKCSEVGRFIVTGFRDLAPGEIDAITVAELVDDKLLSVDEVRFGVGRRLREALEEIRLSARSGARAVPVRPLLAA